MSPIAFFDLINVERFAFLLTSDVFIGHCMTRDPSRGHVDLLFNWPELPHCAEEIHEWLIFD